MRGSLGLGGRLQPRGGLLALQACLPDILLRRDVGHCALIGLPRLLKLSPHAEDVPHVLIEERRFLPLVLLQYVPWWAGFEEYYRLLKHGNGFGMRVDAHRNLAGAAVIGDGLPWKTCALIVGGNLSADGIQVSLSPAQGARVYRLERLRDTTMEEAPVSGTQGSVGLFPQLVVAKVIGLGRSRALFAHNAPLPQFIQSAHHCIFTLYAGLCKHDEGKLAPDNRSYVCHFARQLGRTARALQLARFAPLAEASRQVV